MDDRLIDLNVLWEHPEGVAPARLWGNCLRAFAEIPYSPGVPSIYYNVVVCESHA